jgi:hypothetical protein
LLITPDAQIGDGVRVFIHAREALIFGAALGVCYPVVRYLLQRFAPPPPTQADDERPWYVRASFSLAWAIVRIGVLVLGGWLAYRAVRGRIEQLLPFLGKA